MKCLVIVDMQNDFIDGVLGTSEAQAIVPKVVEKIKNFSDGYIVATLDTHGADYLSTMEGKNLPVPHCIEGTEGWYINKDIVDAAATLNEGVVLGSLRKSTFGSTELASYLSHMCFTHNIEAIEFIGVCTDICVISNAMLAKAFLPEVPIIVDASCCAGVTPESHKNALAAMKQCHIIIENEV